MPKHIIEFNLPEETNDLKLAMSAGVLSSACHDLSNYARTLYKYDERESLPKDEVIEKIRELLAPYYESGVE